MASGHAVNKGDEAVGVRGELTMAVTALMTAHSHSQVLVANMTMPTGHDLSGDSRRLGRGYTLRRVVI
jgi:hypothetical protein